MLDNIKNVFCKLNTEKVKTLSLVNAICCDITARNILLYLLLESILTFVSKDLRTFYFKY